MPTSPSTLKNVQKPNLKAASVTPMMRQYFEIKNQHEDAILFYRLGDFYEMFYEDAIEASRLLDLTLTRRNKASDEPIPLCGVPYHAAEGYIAKLIKFGKKVVVCEQTEDPKKAKGLVKRGVSRVVTPGIVLEDQSLSARANNFLLGFVKDSSRGLGDYGTMGLGDWGTGGLGDYGTMGSKSPSPQVSKSPSHFHCAVCDVSTGSLEYFSVKNFDGLLDEVAKVVRGFRLSGEFTQVEFAKKLGISAANLCDLEKGRKTPSPLRAANIAKKLGLSKAFLIQVAMQDLLRRQNLRFKVYVTP